jgi:hypothetical protein
MITIKAVVNHIVEHLGGIGCAIRELSCDLPHGQTVRVFVAFPDSRDVRPGDRVRVEGLLHRDRRLYATSCERIMDPIPPSASPRPKILEW